MGWISYFNLIECDFWLSCRAVTSISVPSWRRAYPWPEGKYLCRNTGKPNPTIICTLFCWLESLFVCRKFLIGLTSCDWNSLLMLVIWFQANSAAYDGIWKAWSKYSSHTCPTTFRSSTWIQDFWWEGWRMHKGMTSVFTLKLWPFYCPHIRPLFE